MRIQKFAVLLFVALALPACSLDKQRIDYKVASARASGLEVPPDLTAPVANEQYAIPDADGALTANYSDYSKGGAARSATVLPELKNVRLERNEKQRWLLVGDKAENVWPVVKSFWMEMGFAIPVDNPQAGVMETDWRENRANSPQYFERGALGNGKVLDSLRSAGQRDQYVSRLERSQDGLSTEVYIKQQTMQEVQILNKKEPKWLPGASDPEIEIAILQMLKAKLEGETNISSASAASVNSGKTSTQHSINVEMGEVSGSKAIHVKEPFDKSWRKVGLALDKAHIVVADKDRSKGVFLLHSTTEKNGQKLGYYQVTVRESGEACDIFVRNPEGESDSESLRLLEALFNNIEK